MESVEATIGIIAIFPKLSICFLSVCRGISKIFELADYRFIVTPVGLLIINLSYFLYDSIMDFIAWSIEIWPYYAFPFQVIVPVIVLIIGTIKKKSVF
jgi:spore germination protein KB